MPSLLKDRQGQLSLFIDRSRNTKLLEGFGCLFPIKLQQIWFSGSREEVEYVSGNQMTGRPSWFSDLLEKHKLGIRS